MHLDVAALKSFYAEPLGLVTRRLVGDALRRQWPDATGSRVLGLGYATPYLRPYLGRAERVLGFMPAAQGVVPWPPEGPSVTALVDECDLPLPDQSVDRVLVVHCFEMAENPAEMLREVWRVLAPGGRLIAVVPSRQGLWARFETTPFGHGRPFSRTQLDGLLRQALLSPEHWTHALSMPPVSSRAMLKMGPVLERVGRKLGRAGSGVLIVEASKQLHQGIAVRAPARVKMRPALVPRAAPWVNCGLLPA